MSNNTVFVVGDVVRLKSGSPDMTIYYISQEDNIIYGCKWFNDVSKTFNHDNFTPETLSKVTKKTE